MAFHGTRATQMTPPFRVVLIDDDPDLRQLIKVTLEFTAGWEVATAGNGADGIELVRKLNPDAVVADVMMPGMDGYEVCHRLKQDPRSATIPVVLLTARKELDDALIESSGAAGVLFKPFEPDELAARILQLCGGTNG